MFGEERIVADDPPPICCEDNDRTGIEPIPVRETIPKLFRSNVPKIRDRLFNASC